MRRYPRNPGRAERRGITAADVDPEQLRLGTEHELEHTDDRREARRIALDHLAEDPRYYTHLSACEGRYASNAELRLWRFNRRTGLWNVARTVTEETAQQWLEVWSRDEPGEYFKISRSRPSGNPERRHARNGPALSSNGSGYHVWALAKGSNTPLSSEGPWGPYDLTQAKYFARIGASEGVHDRIVTRGLGSDIVRRYRAGSGERLI